MSRIYQYPVVTEIGSDDYLALGSATNGSRAILASDLAPVIGNKTITERGTYEASDDNMDGYGQVTVDIPYTDIHVASGDIATFEGEDLPLKSLKVAVTPYQDLSHGDPSPSNICPIIGWDEVNVTRCGKNLWGGEKLADDIVSKVPQATKDTTNKTVSYSAGYVSGKVLFDNFKPNTIYTIFMMTLSSANNVMVRYTDGTNTYINKYSITVTQANKSIECIIGTWSTGTTVLKYEECGIFEGVITAEDFVAYNGATYTIDLNGTRYGGTLDATDGTFLDMIDHIASYNGEELPPAWISDRDVYAVGTTPTIGAEVVYPRATPITVQLAPTPVKSLEGENDIFANCGAVDVEYQTVWVRPSN